MTTLPITRVVLYKHGVGYFEREGEVDGEAALGLTFRESEVSDVLKSLTVLDLGGGHVASVSYDSTKPLQQVLADVALSIPDQGSLAGLLPQIKGARVAARPAGGERSEGLLLGVDLRERQSPQGVVRELLIALLTDGGEVRSFELHNLDRLEVLDQALRRDLDYYLRTLLSAKKKDARTFTLFAQGQGRRTVRLSYTVGAPVWKATYRILLGEEERPPTIQGWAVVDNTQDEDWEGVELTLVAGLPVSFIHDLYTPRYIRRPVVAVRETTGVLPPEVQEGMATEIESVDSMLAEFTDTSIDLEAMPAPAAAPKPQSAPHLRVRGRHSGVSSMPAQVRERKLGDLFEYDIEHPVTIRRNQSALVPIVLRVFAGRPVLLHNRDTRPENPMRCVEFKNTMGLTLEGGPVTVLEGGSYVGEAMLDTLKPSEQRLVPYAVELGVRVLDNIDSHREGVHRVVIRDRRLTTYRAQVQKTTYTFHNKAEEAYTVYLDHPRGGTEWQLLDTPEPVEVTEGYWRFRFDLPGKTTASFLVRQRLTVSHVQTFADMSLIQLGYWLEQRYVDSRTEQTLRQAAEYRHRLAQQEQQIKALNEQTGHIHAEQGRIRENLQALGDRPSEKELRERYVRILGNLEDRLGQIATEVRSLEGERDQCREQLNALLGSLEYEAEVS